jgi:hypothetical protein
MQSPHSASPISMLSSDSRYPELVLCDVHGEPLDLADKYCQQCQLAIRSAPPRSSFINPMSSVGSYNASNESPVEAPLSLPPRLNASSPMPLSPRTIRSTLNVTSSFIRASVLPVLNRQESALSYICLMFPSLYLYLPHAFRAVYCSYRLVRSPCSRLGRFGIMYRLPLYYK